MNWKSLPPDEVARRRAIVEAAGASKIAAHQIGISENSLGAFRNKYMPLHRWPKGRGPPRAKAKLGFQRGTET